MKIRKLYDGLKYIIVGVVCLMIAFFLYTSLCEVSCERKIEESLEVLPNYNYVSDIKTLKEEGKLGEALDMARFVISHPDMPGQEDAKALEKDLENERTSLWGRTKRATRGFVTGSGNSTEELVGGMTSDMIIWGDFRDLLKQGYYKVTGEKTDPVIVAFAGIGLATEVVDFADWAPAVLKSFRKIGALSSKFTDFIITAAKKSAKGRKLDGALRIVFGNLRCLVDKMGLARTATVFKYVDDPADLVSITAVAQKNADAAYFTVKNGGADGVNIVKRLGDTEVGVASMARAAKKGPAGIAWLKRGGAGHKHVVRTRLGVRFLKNLRMHRPQQLLKEAAKEFPRLREVLWMSTILALLGAFFSFVVSVRKFYGLKSQGQTCSNTKTTAQRNKETEERVNTIGSTSLKLSDVLTVYKEEVGCNWDSKSEFENMAIIQNFIDIVGDCSLNQLSRENVRNYKAKLLKFPKNVTKNPKYRDKTIQEIMKMDVPEEDRLSAETLKDRFAEVKCFLIWLRRQGYPVDKVFEDFG